MSAISLVCGALAEQPLPDIRNVPVDLILPELSEDQPGAGKRVRIGLFPSKPPVVLYLPLDWEAGKKFPLIIELAGNGNFQNSFDDICHGLPEGSKIGFGLTGGKGSIWVCAPFLNEAGDKAAVTWWGDAPEYSADSTVAFLKSLVPAICERYSADSTRVILCGFSRGAIAANVIGLHDDEIAKLWCGFFCYSHYDGMNSRWPFAGNDGNSARQRLLRLNGRPQLICSESPLAPVRKHIDNSGAIGDFTFVQTGFRNHNDAWILRPSPARDAARKWFSRLVGATP